jgi:hypothetical protein
VTGISQFREDNDEETNMKRRLYTIWTVLLVAMLAVTPVFAGNIKLSGSFTSGSIHFDGYATGVGGYDGVTLEIFGIGIPNVLCTNLGGNDAPGQNPPKVTVTGTEYFSPNQITETTKKGKTPVYVTAAEGEIVLTGTEGGCPNDNWTATVLSIDWVGAVINVYEGLGTGGALLKSFEFACDPSMKNGDNLYCTQVSVTTY